MQLIANLQAQLSALQGGGTATGVSCPSITRSLYIGLSDSETGGEVTALQKFLGVSPTGFFGPQTELKVKEWQKNKGIVSSGTADTTGYGFVGEKTRALMRSGCGGTAVPPVEVVTKLSVSVTESETTNGQIHYTLRVPKSYAGYTMVLLMNPESVVTPISSGELKTFTIASNWDGGTLSGTLDVSRAHQGFASNQGGVHWFNTVTGTYKLAAVVYPWSPFKPGTDMEYISVAEQQKNGPAAVAMDDSNTFRIGSEEQSGTIYNESLKTYNENPFITGTASGATYVVFSMSRLGKSMYDSGRIAVVYNTGRPGSALGVWSHRINTELDPGTYRMSLYASDSSTQQGKLLDTETLTVRHYPVINEFILNWEGDFRATFSWYTDEADQCYIARINENGSRFVIANELGSSGEYTATIARGSDGGALDHVLVCVGEPTSDGKDAPSVEQLIDWKG